jgi:hypothetical protein
MIVLTRMEIEPRTVMEEKIRRDEEAHDMINLLTFITNTLKIKGKTDKNSPDSLYRT